jgi:hypothetical protein
VTPAPKPSDLIAPRHRRVAKMVGYALALTMHEGLTAYAMLARVLRDALPTPERTGLAFAALSACEPREAQAIVEAIFTSDEPAGPPTESLLPEAIPEDAQWWAAAASQEELLAYGMAILDRLSPQERALLMRAVAGSEAA